MKKNIIIYLFLLISCYNPFFPPTGPPSGSGRDVIEQLERSYENQQITLFKELLSDSFKFYVSPSFISEYASKPYIQSEIIDDSEYYYIPGKEYHYWTGDEEKRLHENLFKSAASIDFSSSILKDTHFVIDTSIFQKDSAVYDTSYDTTNLEIRIMNGNIEINLNAPIEEHTSYTIEIGEQVFYLERTGEDSSLWVINKWFDLGTASN